MIILEHTDAHMALSWLFICGCEEIWFNRLCVRIRLSWQCCYAPVCWLSKASVMIILTHRDSRCLKAHWLSDSSACSVYWRHRVVQSYNCSLLRGKWRRHTVQHFSPFSVGLEKVFTILKRRSKVVVFILIIELFVSISSMFVIPPPGHVWWEHVANVANLWNKKVSCYFLLKSRLSRHLKSDNHLIKVETVAMTEPVILPRWTYIT